MRYILRLMSLASISLIANTNFVFVGLAESLHVVNAETNMLIASYPLPPIGGSSFAALTISTNGRVASLTRGQTNLFQIFDPDYFEVYRNQEPNPIATLSGSSRSFEDHLGLSPNTSYEYTVVSVWNNGLNSEVGQITLKTD
ncbi:MAG: hypothetical protein ACOYK9_06020 [Chlamydiia bacterium]